MYLLRGLLGCGNFPVQNPAVLPDAFLRPQQGMHKFALVVPVVYVIHYELAHSGEKTDADMQPLCEALYLSLGSSPRSGRSGRWSWWGRRSCRRSWILSHDRPPFRLALYPQWR